MPNKSITRDLLLAMVLCALVLIGGLSREAIHATAATAGAWPARCSINADCGRAICVDDVCISTARECLIDAECGRHGVCTHDGMCYRFR